MTKEKKERNKRTNTRTMLVEWSSVCIKAISDEQMSIESQTGNRVRKPEAAVSLMERLVTKGKK